MKARINKGGWWWLGVERHAGDVIDVPSEQWLAHRVADGLCEPIDDAIETQRDEPPADAIAPESDVRESADLRPSENAMQPRPGAKKRR
jgi:hypothetical protein